jgi:hypothetical protein
MLSAAPCLATVAGSPLLGGSGLGCRCAVSRDGWVPQTPACSTNGPECGVVYHYQLAESYIKALIQKKIVYQGPRGSLSYVVDQYAGSKSC